MIPGQIVSPWEFLVVALPGPSQAQPSSAQSSPVTLLFILGTKQLVVAWITLAHLELPSTWMEDG